MGFLTAEDEQAVKTQFEKLSTPVTLTVFASELQRDWARTATVPPLAQMLIDHMGNVGTSLLWEWQLLAAPKETAAA